MKFFKRFNIFLNENENKPAEPVANTGQNTEQQKPEAKAEQPADNNTILKELKSQLDNWTTKYGSVFKFINAQPKVVTKDVKAAIMDESKAIVDEAIKSIIAILSNEKYKDKLKAIEVVGHTSSTWGKETGKPAAVAKNKALSMIRAQSVVDTIKALGGDPIKDIAINPVGMGLTQRIIQNDAVEGEPTAGAGMKEVTNFESLKTITNPEQKQVINRRVVIKLPDVDAQYEIPKQVVQHEEKKEEKKVVKAPNTPLPTSIQFNFDSYIPTKESIGILESFAKQLAEYNNQSENKKTDVFICSHSHKGKNEKKDEKKQEENIFFISLNRAVMVKNILTKHAPDVKFHLIPVSFYQMLGESSKANKRVELYFEQNEKVESAKKIFGKLANRYDVEQSNGEYSGDTILQNRILRSDVIKNLNTALDNEQQHRFIPLELWHSKFGGKHEPNFQKFRDKIVKLVGNEKDVDQFVYNRL
jgi:outer membrane protein OmpA-like peptidoglycan-associated protein